MTSTNMEETMESVAIIGMAGRFPGAETVALSGRPESARDDLMALGERLGYSTVIR